MSLEPGRLLTRRSGRFPFPIVGIAIHGNAYFHLLSLFSYSGDSLVIRGAHSGVFLPVLKEFLPEKKSVKNRLFRISGTACELINKVFVPSLTDAFDLNGVGLAVDDDSQVTGAGRSAHLGGDAVVDDGHGRSGRPGGGGRGGGWAPGRGDGTPSACWTGMCR